MRLNVWAVLCILLFLAGVVFYVVMGTTQGAWKDVGVYSLTVTLLGFGVFGFLASQATGRKPETPSWQPR